MSVVHFVLRRCGHLTAPIKSKEPLIFHCGVRRFTAAPIFSQHTVGDKHKVNDGLQCGCTCPIIHFLQAYSHYRIYQMLFIIQGQGRDTSIQDSLI